MSVHQKAYKEYLKSYKPKAYKEMREAGALDGAAQDFHSQVREAEEAAIRRAANPQEGDFIITPEQAAMEARQMMYEQLTS